MLPIVVEIMYNLMYTMKVLIFYIKIYSQFSLIYKFIYFQTSYMHEKDVYHVTKSQLLANMDSMMGGRAAEELIFGSEKVTTGASSDLEV